MNSSGSAADQSVSRRSAVSDRRKSSSKGSLSSLTATLSSDSIKIYLQAIAEVALLTAQEEVSLAKSIESGLKASEEIAEFVDAEQWELIDHSARHSLQKQVRSGLAAEEMLTAANLRLVVSIAKRYLGRGLPLLDLVQEGNLGLMRAVKKFDYSKGFKFSTYATWWIRQGVTRALADQSRTIRVPIHVVESMNRVKRVQRSLQQSLEREPTVDELSAATDLSSEKISEILSLLKQNPVSLDVSVGDEEDSSLVDFIADTGLLPSEVAVKKSLERSVGEVLAELSEREAEVLQMRFGLLEGRSKTLEEVGKAFGVTRERIRQIESRALAKLRHPIRSDGLKEYLDR